MTAMILLLRPSATALVSRMVAEGGDAVEAAAYQMNYSFDRLKSAARGSPTDWDKVVLAHDHGGVCQASPDDQVVIDIDKLSTLTNARLTSCSTAGQWLRRRHAPG